MRRVGSTTVLLDIDIPEPAGYHLYMKSGWNLLVAQFANPSPLLPLVPPHCS